MFTNGIVHKLCTSTVVKDLTSSEKHQINVAINNAVRRSFGFRIWQSIRQIRDFYSFKPIEVVFAEARGRFLKGLPNHRNETLRFLSNLLSTLHVD